MFNDNEAIFTRYQKRSLISESTDDTYTFPNLSKIYNKDIESIEGLLEEGFGDYVDKFKGFIKDSVLNKLIKLILSKIEVDNTTVKESKQIESEILKSTNYNPFNNTDFLIKSFLNESEIKHYFGEILEEAVSNAQAIRNRKYVSAIKAKFEVMARQLAEAINYFSPKQKQNKWDIIKLIRGHKKTSKPISKYIKALYDEYETFQNELTKFGESYDPKMFKYNVERALEDISNRASGVISQHDPTKPYVSLGLPDVSMLKPKKRMVAASSARFSPVSTPEPEEEVKTPQETEGAFKRILNWLHNHRSISVTTAITLLGAIAYMSDSASDVIKGILGATAGVGVAAFLPAKLEASGYTMQDFIKAVKKAAKVLVD